MEERFLTNSKIQNFSDYLVKVIDCIRNESKNVFE